MWCRQRLHKDLKKSPQQTLSPSLVLSAIKEAWSPYFSCEQKADLVVDCQLFQEPTEKDKWYHTGLHPAVLTDYTNEPYFEDRLQWVHKHVMKEVTNGKRAVFVYCVDRLGRFASMALAKVLIECVKADPKLQLGRLSTISNLRLLDCGPCDRCCFWDHRFQNKVDACDRMRKKWLDWDTTPRPVEQ